ncbi:hypothetical protein VRK_10110 [Vibrio sp. MEBiC08052]|nr:hypothetical protein VRK_10110 [Vibrio sp. MEBiC08052]
MYLYSQKQAELVPDCFIFKIITLTFYLQLYCTVIVHK